MKPKVLFVERKPFESVSIEKAFRQIAAHLSDEFDVEFQQLPFGNRFSDTLRNLFLFRKRDATIYHITGQVHYIALRFRRRNTVLSIMDVRFLYREPGLRRWLLKKLYLDWPIRRLDQITAISEKTKQEIVHHSGCDESKVLVLDLPLVMAPDADEPKNFDRQNPTILQVGTMENKNIPNLARGLARIKCKFRVVGKMTTTQIDALNENSIEFENVDSLAEEDLRKEYRNCDIVAFCSTFEGFGLPIIEAQAMKKPVVTSDLSPMKEISGGAAYLADPHDVDDMRQGFEKIIRDDGYRAELIRSGLENIKRFDPKAVAKQYEILYKTILRSN